MNNLTPRQVGIARGRQLASQLSAALIEAGNPYKRQVQEQSLDTCDSLVNQLQFLANSSWEVLEDSP